MFSDWISVDIPSLLRTTLFKPLLSSLPVTQWELRGPIFNMMTVGGPASRVCQCRRLLQGYEINVFFIIKPHVFFFFFSSFFYFSTLVHRSIKCYLQANPLLLSENQQEGRENQRHTPGLCSDSVQKGSKPCTVALI